MDLLDQLVAETQDEGVITQVIRPAAVIPDEAARAVLMQLALRDVRVAGVWDVEPNVWRRFDVPWEAGADHQGASELMGTIQIAYGVPTRYEITLFRATITREGTAAGWTVEALCDEALQLGGLTLSSCPRADLAPPPRPFRMRDAH
ncbi:MAG: hypothetical protein QOG34_429 [Frankiaceae bacterium]|nr:hypothetical protein [Frankiaceae bacterium]